MSIKPPADGSPAASAKDAGSNRVEGADQPQDVSSAETAGTEEVAVTPPARPKEIGGPPGPEPTRYGDWQFNGRVTDF